MDLAAILQILAPVLGGFLGVGGIGAYFAYRSAKPKSEAEANKVNAEVVVTFADGWEKYAKKLEERLDIAEKAIAENSRALDEQDKKYREIIAKKDAEIKDLQDRNVVLEERVATLEAENHKYKTADGKVEDARTTLHQSVDSAVDELKVNK